MLSFGGQPVDPGGIDIDMAGRTGAGTAAIGLDPGDAVVTGPFHDGQAIRHLDHMFLAAMFHVSDLRHLSLFSVHKG
jgi:hypothetical protein